MKRKEIILLSGIPASGKSTYIQSHLKSGEKVISRDKVRFSLVKPEDKYFSKEKEVFNTFVQLIKESFDDENITTVYADATHINEGSRLKLINALKLFIEKNDISLGCIYFDTSLETCLERNKEREGRSKVPEKDIENMYNRFTVPTLDEGFDFITRFTKYFSH